MKRWCLLVCFLLAGCSLENQPAPPVYINPQTALALTPSATAAPSPTTAPTATATTAPSATTAPTATTAPSATATPPPPTPTAPPTATPNPQLADLGWCEANFGPPEQSRFSAQLLSIAVQQLDLLDEVTLVLTNTVGSVHGSASCLPAVGWQRVTDTAAPGDAVIAVSFADWALDDVLAASPVTETVALTATGNLRGVRVARAAAASRGLTVGVGLGVARPFHIRTAANPERVIIEIQRTDALRPEDDALAQPAGEAAPPDRPVFFLQNNDVWRWLRGQAAPVVKTDELEIALAVSPDHETLAVCRAPADSDPANLPYGVRAALWVLRADGSDARPLADVGGCADLAFAQSGKTLAFTVNTAAAPPVRLSVWTVPVVVGEPAPASPTDDEWDRFGAQWLPDGNLAYRGASDGGQTALFVRGSDGAERELTAQLLTGNRYSGVGSFVLNAADGTVAVEALRAEKPGADLVVLDASGKQVTADQRGYWQRPLGFTADGLLYLTTECPSAAVQRYTLRVRRGTTSTDLLSGLTAAGLGAPLVADGTLIYSRFAVTDGAIYGPAVQPRGDTPTALWAMALDGSARQEFYRAPVAVTELR